MSIVRNEKPFFFMLGALAIALCYNGLAQAQGRGSGRPLYDAKTETTVAGVVQEVREVAGPGRNAGVHIVLKTDSATLEVHVGPSWYLKQHKYELTKGDQIVVTGSKVKLQDVDVLLAREIKKGGTTWTLRDAQGIPLWSRTKRS